MALKYKKYIKEDSPLNFMTKFNCLKKELNFVFQFSRYVNSIGTRIDKRDIETTDNISNYFYFLEDKFNTLHIDQEIAFHSIIDINGETFHIPLIDFYTGNNEQIFDSIIKIQKLLKADIYLFKTGRSFHAYIDTLLSVKEWHVFMGEMLLLNKYSKIDHIIDDRWVGHSLIHGYSALRLSSNTALYISYPTFWEKISYIK